MSSKPAQSVVGRGAPELDLSLEELRAIVEQALSSVERAGRDLYLVAPH